ncbi:MAG: hypothetical protein KatS3mg037_2768 [Ignavibacterium sp.]|nr:MAG: hypothetical protein KatS3mg037_2768 [Ignavibacterium sp.]
MKISVVTPSFNQGRFIEQTILSVLEQDYSNFEHIIMDGGSEDNTIDILKKYKHLKWISEKDSGQTSAINKGVALATGEICTWLNSDDYFEKNIFSLIVEFFEQNPSCDLLYGDITYVDQENNLLFRIKGDEINFNSLLHNPDLIRQPSFFWRRDKFFEFGGLDESLNLVMDLDLFLKFFKYGNTFYINRNLSFYRTYPSTKTLSKRKDQAVEIYRVMRRYSERISLDMYWFVIKRYLGLPCFIPTIKKIIRKLSQQSQ